MSKEQVREPQLAADASAQVQTIEEMRARLDAFRTEETLRYERAKREREELTPVEEPDIVFVELYEREEAIREEIEAKTRLNGEELGSLKRFSEEKKSWNPLTRAAATRAEEALRADQQRRYDEALRDAMQKFKENEAPRISERYERNERRYEQYSENAYKLEAVMNKADSFVHHLLPAFENELNVVERVGMVQIEGISENAKFRDISAAISRCYKNIPEETRRMIAQDIRRERKGLDRLRDSLSMDD